MSAIFGIYYSISELPDVIRRYARLTDERAPEIVYHYSSAIGAVGILKSKRLWATNASYVNDATELTYGRELLDSVLKQRFGSAEKTPEWVKQVGFSVTDFLTIGTPYMACFCENSDLLSQWRGYGSDCGVSVGLDSALLTRDGRALLLRVLYDPISQRSLIERVIDEFEPEVAAAAKSAVDMGPFFAQSRLAIALAFSLAACKHPTFSEEQEWRLLPLSLPQVEFRVDGGSIKPYIEFELTSPVVPVMPLRSVIIGPGRHSTLTRDSIRMLVEQLGFRGVPVTVSQVPLR